MPSESNNGRRQSYPKKRMRTEQEIEQELKHCPRYMQVAWELCGYLIDQKDRIPALRRTGKFAYISIETHEVCRRFKCREKTLWKAIAVLKEMGLVCPLFPAQ